MKQVNKISHSRILTEIEILNFGESAGDEPVEFTFMSVFVLNLRYGEIGRTPQAGVQRYVPPQSTHTRQSVSCTQYIKYCFTLVGWIIWCSTYRTSLVVLTLPCIYLMLSITITILFLNWINMGDEPCNKTLLASLVKE